MEVGKTGAGSLFQENPAGKKDEDIEPISYLKAHASEMIRELGTRQRTMVITQDGEAKAVLQDIHTYEQTRESMTMLKILAQSNKELKNGAFEGVGEAFADIRKQVDPSND